MPDTARKRKLTTKRLLSKSTSGKRKKTSDGRGPAYLGLGSNLGDRAGNLNEAIRELGRTGSVVAVSRFRETEPIGFRDQPLFLNAAVRIETDLSASELLAATQEIERRLGRVPTFRNGPRVIDIDLLDVRGEVRRTRKLTLPHPRLHRRRFVLDPLAEISPRWKHPKLRKTARELLKDLGSPTSRPRGRGGRRPGPSGLR